MNRPHLKETSRQCYLENQEIVSSGQTEKKTPEKTPGVEMKNCGNSWTTGGISSMAQAPEGVTGNPTNRSHHSHSPDKNMTLESS